MGEGRRRRSRRKGGRMIRLRAGQGRRRGEKKTNLESRREGEKTRWERGEGKNLGGAFRGVLFHSAGSLSARRRDEQNLESRRERERRRDRRKEKERIEEELSEEFSSGVSICYFAAS